MNNKIHSTTKASPFMANYGREVKMGGDIRKRGKVESTAEFVERMKKIHEEAGVALKKTQEKIKRYADHSRKETEKWKRGDKVLLSTKDLVLKERAIRKLIERYVELYKIEEVVTSNAVKLWLPASMRIHLVINVSQIVQYKEQVKGQKKEKEKPIEVEGAEEWEVKRILNKKKIRGVEKYLVWWKGFTAEDNTWERKENLKNAREVLEEFEGRMNAEIKRQEKIDIAEERDFRRRELPEKFTAKMLYG